MSRWIGMAGMALLLASCGSETPPEPPGPQQLIVGQWQFDGAEEMEFTATGDCLLSKGGKARYEINGDGLLTIFPASGAPEQFKATVGPDELTLTDQAEVAPGSEAETLKLKRKK